MSAVALAAVLGAGCGDEISRSDTSSATSTTGSTTPSITATTTTTAPITTTTVAATTTTAAPAPTTTTAPAELEQLAIWPAADVAFTTPEAAAADFVSTVLHVPPTLSEFQSGDARSGEIVVFSPGEGDAGQRVPRSVLLLRQLGPDDGWFVVAAVNDNAAITAPASSATVQPGPLTVSGVGRGFEATVIVSAVVPGRSGGPLDQEITSGGSFETPEPYTVSLDLSAAEPGQTVVLLVRGGVGLETDPGDFGAIPVKIAGRSPR